MRRLAGRVPIVVLVRSPESAVALSNECPLPIFYAPTISEIEQLMETQDIKAVFYVNQNIRKLGFPSSAVT